MEKHVPLVLYTRHMEDSQEGKSLILNVSLVLMLSMTSLTHLAVKEILYGPIKDWKQHREPS